MPELDVSQQRLLALLGQHAESPTLEFAAACDLSERRDLVELATEVGALAARGGSIVVGVDNQGTVQSLLDETQAALFDEATLRDKLGRYLPSTLALRTARHTVDGLPVVLIEVGAHPDGAAVFLADGIYEEEGKPKIAFRKGEFFVRHGTKSERPDQEDIRRLRQDAVEQSRLWLDEVRHVQETIAEIGEVAENECGGDLRKPLGGYYVYSRIPTIRMQLFGRLTILKQFGGPSLPSCDELAIGSTATTYGRVLGQVFSAMDEVTRVLREQAEQAALLR